MDVASGIFASAASEQTPPGGVQVFYYIDKPWP
jgi:hypothetical protein